MRSVSLAHAEDQLRAALDRGDLNDIDAWSELVDMLQELDRRPPPRLGEAALWYASLGLHVFPLSAMSKVPRRGTAGLHDATTDARVISRWWTEHPDANVAIATGHLVDVLDIDGEEGQLSLSKLIVARKPDIDSSGPLPGSLLFREALGIVSTPRPGGVHLFYPASGRGNRAGLLPHIDQRGLGGYVVAPPSRTADGGYEWVRVLDVTGLLATTGTSG
jgi:hypothetical protein